MLKFKLFNKDDQPNILCLGAHPDDIEIGCGGTILQLIDQTPKCNFYWAIFSSNETRLKEAQQSANLFLNKVQGKQIKILDFKESYFPFVGAEIKDYFEKIKHDFSPDLIFTHTIKDAHQDHQLIRSLTWNTFRNHLILEYEIPKYDGDLETPNLYVCLDRKIVDRKIRYLFDSFQTQKEKQWFTKDTFIGIMRIRGVESNSPSKYAEAFHCRKATLQ